MFLSILKGIVAGLLSIIILRSIPIIGLPLSVFFLGPIAAGFVASKVANGGLTRGASVGFLSGIVGTALSFMLPYEISISQLDALIRLGKLGVYVLDLMERNSALISISIGALVLGGWGLFFGILLEDKVTKKLSKALIILTCTIIGVLIGIFVGEVLASIIVWFGGFFIVVILWLAYIIYGLILGAIGGVAGLILANGVIGLIVGALSSERR